MSGAFQTSREIFDHTIWKNVVDFRLFFLICGKAIFSEDGYRVSEDLKLDRGQWCRSTRKLQEDLEYIENRQIKTYSTSVLNRCIKRLEALQMICTRTHKLGTVFTVVNYSKYQSLSNYSKGNLERNLEQSENSVGTVLEQCWNNNKNVEEREESKEGIKDMSDSIESNFDEWWKMYPKKDSRKTGLASFKKEKAYLDMDKLREGTIAYINHQQDNRHSLCGGTVFLNQRRWENDWSYRDNSFVTSPQSKHMTKQEELAQRLEKRLGVNNNDTRNRIIIDSEDIGSLPERDLLGWNN